jgi:ribosomal protein S18 acetylase RimI-like enzyme
MAIVDQRGVQEVCDILAEAFEDDPVLRWVNAGGGFVPSFFQMILPAFVAKGLTYVDQQQLGAASWVGPHDHVKWPFTLGNAVRLARLCGVRGLYRLARCGSVSERHHPREPHYYLFAIGARPRCQGQGVGSALIGHMLRRCDQEQMPAYLENSREANLDFYCGHGFEVQREIRFARQAPPVWLMWREPRAVGR